MIRGGAPVMGCYWRMVVASIENWRRKDVWFGLMDRKKESGGEGDDLRRLQAEEGGEIAVGCKELQWLCGEKRQRDGREETKRGAVKLPTF